MQSTHQKIILGFLLLLVAGCTFADRNSFDRAIATAREQGRDKVVAAKSSLPFFSRNNLDPVWDEKSPIVKIPEISLLDQHGQKQNQNFFHGQVSIVGFFFASCKGFCPTLILQMKDIEKSLRGYPNVRYALFTVDPEHDDVKVLAAYAKHQNLGSHWYLLTGSKEKIYSLARETFQSQAFRRAKADGERNFVHSEHFYVIDQSGRLRAVINGTELSAPSEARSVLERLSTEHKYAGISGEERGSK